MRRFLSSCALACVLLLGSDSGAGAANLQFNFNSDADGWTFGKENQSETAADSLWWEWHKAPSSSDGGLQAKLVVSGSNAGAWAMSPCLDLLQNKNQPYIHIDIGHYTIFPEGILGQVQFRFDTGSGWGSWLGIPSTAWDSSSGHHVPTQTTVFPPLLDSNGIYTDLVNAWPAFVGTNPSDAPNHTTSSFTLNWADYGLANGDDIQFRLMVATDPARATAPAALLWEMNDFQIDGAELCPVPEIDPAGMGSVMALVTGALGMLERRRSRRQAEG